MIGLVLVSHSPTLARGVEELARQMAEGVTMITAGGDEDDGIGTSFEKILAAIDEADDGDGVVVLYDLGSARTTSEMAVEMLDGERAERVRLVDAPFVEGTLAAATRVDAGATLADVVSAARASIASFAADGPDGDPDDTDDADATAGGDAEGGGSAEEAVVATIELQNEVGLHARPASLFARAVGEFDAKVWVATGEDPDDDAFVNARSTLSVVSLGAEQGDRLTIRATGPEAREAVDRLVAMVEDRFGES